MNVLDVAQRSMAWAEARRGIPTCSRFDQILTAAKGLPSAAQNALIDDLLAETLCPDPSGLILPPRISADMEYGMKLEAEARCSFEFDYAKGEVREVGFVLSDCGRFGGSPDALVGEDSGVELKAPAASTQIGYLRAGVLPICYRCQVHGYMIVTGRPRWHFYSYARGLDAFHLVIERDDFTAKLAAELDAFCERYNQARARFKLPPVGKTP